MAGDDDGNIDVGKIGLWTIDPEYFDDFGIERVTVAAGFDYRAYVEDDDDDGNDDDILFLDLAAKGGPTGFMHKPTQCPDPMP